MEERIAIQARAEHQKMRLEDFLLDHFGGLSKMYLRDRVKTEFVEVNGRWENIGYRLRPDDLVEVTVDVTRETAMMPNNIPLDIVFEDEHIIVVNKPAGMLVHPSHRENNGTMLNALAFYLNTKSEPPVLGGGFTLSSDSVAFVREQHQPPSSGTENVPVLLVGPITVAGGSDKTIRPGLPHRLDKQTSGLIVVAKTAMAHRRLSGDFMKKRVEKRYLALVDGIVDRDEGSIEAPIGRFAELKMWSVKEDGKHSESRFWVRERYADTTLIELEPVTGRTNQLRIHCELIGHPIVGDIQRGGREFERLCLHAYKLAFRHPITREDLSFENDQCSFPGP